MIQFFNSQIKSELANQNGCFHNVIGITYHLPELVMVSGDQRATRPWDSSIMSVQTENTTYCCRAVVE